MSTTARSYTVPTLSSTRVTDTQAKAQIQLPDLFCSFLSHTPEVNQYYAQVKAESEARLAEKCLFDDRTRKNVFKTDFSYFCAVAAPHADADELRTLCDWGNWLLPFDDMFDTGKFNHDPERAAQTMHDLQAIMRSEQPLSEPTPLIEFHNSIWRRIVQKCPYGVRRRYAEGMRLFCQGAVQQVERCAQSSTPTVQEMMDLRRETVACLPFFALIEYAEGLDLPDEVFEHPAMRKLHRVATDFALIHNDLLSYCKEEREGVPHNVVIICRRSGMSPQQAFDYIGGLLRQCYQEWYLALSQLPQWGETTDREVQRYVDGVQRSLLASANWSFHTERYLGKLNKQVRQSRIMSVLATLPQTKVCS